VQYRREVAQRCERIGMTRIERCTLLQHLVIQRLCVFALAHCEQNRREVTLARECRVVPRSQRALASDKALAVKRLSLVVLFVGLEGAGEVVDAGEGVGVLGAGEGGASVERVTVECFGSRVPALGL
jgi:hypothetical protein